MSGLLIWLYARTRRLRHQVGLHDYEYVPALDMLRCTWCFKGWRRPLK